MELPTISVYCENTTGANAICVSFNNADLYFSYRTPVAIRAPGLGLLVRQNDWGPTTGKHLNAIDGGRKSSRVPGEVFEAKLREL